MLVLVPPTQVLIVVEDGGADGLLGSVLADDVLVDSALEVSRIEVRDAKAGFGEHGAPAGVDGWVIAASEARVEVVGPPGGGG